MSLDYVERIYADYLDNPADLSSEWREYFDKIEGNGSTVSAANRAPSAHATGTFVSLRRAFSTRPPLQVSAPASADLRQARIQERADLRACQLSRPRPHDRQLDPLGRVHPRPIELDLAYYGFSEADLDGPISTTTVRGSNIQTLRQIINRLEETYCGAIGAQFMHIDDLEARDWLQRRLETPRIA